MALGEGGRGRGEAEEREILGRKMVCRENRIEHVTIKMKRKGGTVVAGRTAGLELE